MKMNSIPLLDDEIVESRADENMVMDAENCVCKEKNAVLLYELEGGDDQNEDPETVPLQNMGSAQVDDVYLQIGTVDIILNDDPTGWRRQRSIGCLTFMLSFLGVLFLIGYVYYLYKGDSAIS